MNDTDATLLRGLLTRNGFYRVAQELTRWLTRASEIDRRWYPVRLGMRGVEKVYVAAMQPRPGGVD